ncbi:MAG: hypothetical protein OEW30_05960 [Acidimicrobiia bacterium]|jgi:hypothetical protein|nr:hypothetical protein [Acidimicrobiia bacterium]
MSDYQSPGTLEDQVSEAQVVVRGAILDIRPGREVGTLTPGDESNIRLLVATLRVDEVVSGDLPGWAGSTIQLEIFPGSFRESVDEIGRVIPDQELVAILQLATETGQPQVADANGVDDATLFVLGHPKNVFVEDEESGEVVTPLYTEEIPKFDETVPDESLAALEEQIQAVS